MTTDPAPSVPPVPDGLADRLREAVEAAFERGFILYGHPRTIRTSPRRAAEVAVHAVLADPAVRSILARSDTLRAQAIKEGRAKAEEKAREEVEARVERAVALRGRNWTRERVEQLEGELRALTEALGMDVDFRATHETAAYGRDRVTLGAVREFAALLGPISEMRTAVDRMADGYSVRVNELLRIAQEFESARLGLRQALQSTLTDEA